MPYLPSLRGPTTGSIGATDFPRGMDDACHTSLPSAAQLRDQLAPPTFLEEWTTHAIPPFPPRPNYGINWRHRLSSRNGRRMPYLPSLRGPTTGSIGATDFPR